MLVVKIMKIRKIFPSLSRETGLADGGQTTSPVNLTSSRFARGRMLFPPADRAVVGITCRENLPFPL